MPVGMCRPGEVNRHGRCGPAWALWAGTEVCAWFGFRLGCLPVEVVCAGRGVQAWRGEPARTLRVGVDVLSRHGVVGRWGRCDRGGELAWGVAA